MKRIGFVGLGHMGLPMATNLVRAGLEVSGYDLQESACQAFRQKGGLIADSLQNVTQDKEAVITMLQTGQQVHAVCLGADGLFASASKNTLFIDCSSIDVTSSRAFHEEASKHDLLSLDAPVSGGVAGAEAASLTFMVGGDKVVFEQAKSLLSKMGKTIIHTGIAGNGQAAKICNNMILGISMIAISEAFELAKQLGLEAQKLHEVTTHASGQCWAMSNYVPVPGVLDNVPANRNYEPGFTAAMMLKDLKLSQASAEESGIKTPMGHKAMELYQTLSDLGLAEKDFSSIIKLTQGINAQNT